MAWQSRQRLKKDPSVVPEAQCPEWGIMQGISASIRQAKGGRGVYERIRKGNWVILINRQVPKLSAS